MKADHDGAAAGPEDVVLSTGRSSAVWGFWGTLLWGFAIAAVFIVVQAVVVGVYVRQAIDGAEGAQARRLYDAALTDGDLLSLATIASALVCTLLTMLAVACKRGSELRDYLGLRTVDKRQLALWTAMFIGLLIAMDIVTSLLDRPVTPDVMREIYASTDRKWLLFVGTVVAASIFEELFFRGFIMAGFRRSFVGDWGSVLVSAAFWSLVHVQYDAYGITAIFIIGLFLGAAKLRTDSTLFTIALHALNNGIAFLFLVLLSRME